MEKIIRGKVFVLGDNVDTDQIIPAEFLNLDPSDPDERRQFGWHAMSGVPAGQSGLPDGQVRFVAPGESASEFRVIVAGRNFGCGSSREHAPLAIAEAGCHVVVAESYARIFYRNSINGGYLVPFETPQRPAGLRTGDQVEVDLDRASLKDLTSGKSWQLSPLGDAEEILAAGGLFQYARRAGMIS